MGRGGRLDDADVAFKRHGNGIPIALRDGVDWVTCLRWGMLVIVRRSRWGSRGEFISTGWISATCIALHSIPSTQSMQKKYTYYSSAIQHASPVRLQQLICSLRLNQILILFPIRLLLPVLSILPFIVPRILVSPLAFTTSLVEFV